HQGDEHDETLDLKAAVTTFERLGAKLDEERAKELLGRVEARRTFLFTDIVDSTKLLETLGDERWRKLLTQHDKLVRAHIVESGGGGGKQNRGRFFSPFPPPPAPRHAPAAAQPALPSGGVAPRVTVGPHPRSACA